MQKMLLTGGRFFTLDSVRPEAEALYAENVASSPSATARRSNCTTRRRPATISGDCHTRPGGQPLHLAMFGKICLDRFSRVRSKEKCAPGSGAGGEDAAGKMGLGSELG